MGIIKKFFYTSDNFEGQIFPGLIGSSDKCQFDVTNGYSVFCITLASPTVNELHEFKHGKKEIRMTTFDNMLFFTLKSGNLSWNEAPFSPYLVTQAEVMESIDFYTRKLQVMMINSVDGKVVYCKSFALDTVMSSAFKACNLELCSKPFDKQEYDRELFTIQNIYTTEQIAQIATVRQILK